MNTCIVFHVPVVCFPTGRPLRRLDQHAPVSQEGFESSVDS